MATSEQIQASLGKPGAGIPWIARVYLRLVLKPFKVRKTSWESCEASFRNAHEKISKEFRSISKEKLTQRVLVPPQKGLEDSSRYWSAAMTARHLVIVGQNMEKLIVALSHGQIVSLKVDTAKVKPEIECNDPVEIENYFQFADGFVDRINRQMGDRNSTTTHVHPWFGDLNTKDWFWLSSSHVFIHLQQIRNIIALGSNQS